jgi:hypothetical protein
VISFLARVPTLAASVTFLEFGDAVSPFGVSGTGISPDGSFGAILMGVNDGYTYTLTPANGDPPEESAPVTLQAIVSTPAATIVAGTWHRVILSCDFSGSAGLTAVPDPDGGNASFALGHNDFRLWLSVDDTDCSPTGFGMVLGAPFTGLPPGSVMPYPLTVPYTFGDVEYPGFTIALSGHEFSIPCLAANAAPDYNPAFQIADSLMWTGVSLDTSVTEHRRLFIDAAGRPVNPSVAIAALGTPVYDLRGPALGIGTNRGSAGDLTKTGTVSDYTPGP